MNIIERFKAVRATCNYPFSALRDTIVDLEKNGRRNGFNNPVAQLTIKPTEVSDQYDVSVVVCYKIDNDKYKQFLKEFTVYSFVGMPEDVKSSLTSNKEVKITFTQEDVEEFVVNKNLSIFSTHKALSILLENELSTTAHTASDNLRIFIRDFILYYRVMIYTRQPNGSDKYIKEFLVDSIIGIPESEAKKLKDSHEISLVTNI